MAKDDRKILSGVRVDDKVYTEGQEDDLSAVMTPEMQKRLEDSGAITGTWKAGAKAKDGK